MTQNDSFFIHKCKYCNYQTNRFFNIKRHHNAKHFGIIELNNDENYMCEKVHSRREKVHYFCEKVHSSREKVHSSREKVHSKFICNKCNKKYKSNRYLIDHEKNCKGIDELTCPRCMMNFATKQSKYNHIKRNNCKHKSIIHARKPNQQNIENIQYVEQLTNNIENQNNITNNNIYINNYGNERLDYLNYEKMLEIFKKTYNIPSLLTKEIHFNNNFPENNNIKFIDNKNCLIKKNNGFAYKNLNILVKELINKKGELMRKFAIENKDEICLKMGIELYEQIIDSLIELLLLDTDNYKKQVEIIRDLIKNSKKVHIYEI